MHRVVIGNDFEYQIWDRLCGIALRSFSKLYDKNDELVHFIAVHCKPIEGAFIGFDSNALYTKSEIYLQFDSEDDYLMFKLKFGVGGEEILKYIIDNGYRTR